jgi:hypothetical protein
MMPCVSSADRAVLDTVNDHTPSVRVIDTV